LFEVLVSNLNEHTTHKNRRVNVLVCAVYFFHKLSIYLCLLNAHVQLDFFK